jgi:hypothetical protein
MIVPRTAPPGLTLAVPLHVQLTSVFLGLGSMALGLVYLISPPKRNGPLSNSVMALMEQPLGWVMVVLGLWVVLAAGFRSSRASAHAVAAMCHGAYMAALVATALMTEPPRLTVAAVLSLFAVVAHGGACLDYWKRGYR